jgi:hypothetical protein
MELVCRIPFSLPGIRAKATVHRCEESADLVNTIRPPAYIFSIMKWQGLQSLSAPTHSWTHLWY